MAMASELRAGANDRDTAIKQYAPLVKYVVGRLAIGLPRSSITKTSLSYGGLIEALDRFDGSPPKGVASKLRNQPHPRTIIDALRALDRLPRSVRQKPSASSLITSTSRPRTVADQPTKKSPKAWA